LSSHHLAQLNIARMKYTLEDPAMQPFVDALDPVNLSADSSPGFVWRLQSEGGDATDFEIYNDSRYLVNMSVWQTLEALKAFVASRRHGAIFRRRSEWFEKMDQASSVLWWVPENHQPTVQEAQDRLDMLRTNGPTPDAFNFSETCPHPD
jgi:hypothetical protein